MKGKIITAALLALSNICYAQMTPVLSEIEENNPALKIAAQKAELEKLENHSEAILPNPEVELAYLWGQNSTVGNRRDITVSQSFDIPTLTGMRSRLAVGEDEMALLKYRAERLNVLLEAKNLLIELTFCNALKKELDLHLKNAESLVKSTEKKMQMGGANILEAKKARLHLAAVKGKIAQIGVERNRLLSELTRLNGGKQVTYNAAAYEGTDVLPESFTEWYSEASGRNPVLKYVQKQVEVSQSRVKIEKTATLPGLSIGYTSELARDAKYRGVSLGISIPLWNNGNRIKRADAAMKIAQTESRAAEQEFYERLLSDYNKASGLRAAAEDFRQALESADNRDILLKAQEKGEISMIDYIVESDLYYSALEDYLESERDYRLALASLQSVLL